MKQDDDELDHEFWAPFYRKQDREDEQRKTRHEIDNLRYLVEQQLVGALGDSDYLSIPAADLASWKQGHTKQEFDELIGKQLSISKKQLGACSSLPSDLRRRWTKSLGILDVDAPGAALQIRRLQNDVSDYHEIVQYRTTSGDRDALRLAGELVLLMRDLKFLEKLCARQQSSFTD